MSNSQSILVICFALLIDVFTIVVEQFSETIKRVEVNQLLQILVRDDTAVCNSISESIVSLELPREADFGKIGFEHYGATYMGGIKECWSL